MYGLKQELWDFTRAHVFSSFRCDHDRKDAIQELLIKYRDLANNPKYEGKPENEFIEICKTSARNLVRDICRKRKVRSRDVYHDCQRERKVTIDLGEIDARITLELIKERVTAKAKLVVEALEDGMTPAEIREEAGFTRVTYNNIMKEVQHAVH